MPTRSFSARCANGRRDLEVVHPVLVEQLAPLDLRSGKPQTLGVSTMQIHQILAGRVTITVIVLFFTWWGGGTVWCSTARITRRLRRWS